MGEFSNLNKEQIFAAEAYPNLATLLGKALRASVDQLNHPDEQRSQESNKQYGLSTRLRPSSLMAKSA